MLHRARDQLLKGGGRSKRSHGPAGAAPGRSVRAARCRALPRGRRAVLARGDLLSPSRLGCPAPVPNPAELEPVQQLQSADSPRRAPSWAVPLRVTISVFTDLRRTEVRRLPDRDGHPVEQLARTGRARFELRHYSLGSESTTLAAAAGGPPATRGASGSTPTVRCCETSCRRRRGRRRVLRLAIHLPELDVEAGSTTGPRTRRLPWSKPTTRRGPRWRLSPTAPRWVRPGGTEDLGVEPSAAEITAAAQRLG